MPFEIINQNDYLLVKLSGECTGDEKPSLTEVFQKGVAESRLKLAIIQCGDCGKIAPNFIRELVAVYREVKSKNGQMRLVGANDSIQEVIRANGVDRVLVNKMSLRGALVDFGLVKTKDIDVNFINPFLTSTVKVFKIQCFMELKAQKPFIKSASDPLLMGDVSGIISISSETFSGTLAISMTEKIFVQIVKNMLGETVPGITSENVDLIGELANMILGQAKVELGTLGYKVEMALPSCVWGKDHKIKHFGSGKCMVLPFETEFGTIYSEIMTNNGVGTEQKAA
jgi:chemotaxis protein CheX